MLSALKFFVLASAALPAIVATPTRHDDYHTKAVLCCETLAPYSSNKDLWGDQCGIHVPDNTQMGSGCSFLDIGEWWVLPPPLTAVTG